MITDVGLNKITIAIKNIIDHGIIVIDGEEKELPINSFNIKDNTLDIYLWIDETFIGKIGDKFLVDKDGDKIVVNRVLFETDATNGLFVIFRIVVTEESEDINV